MDVTDGLIPNNQFESIIWQREKFWKVVALIRSDTKLLMPVSMLEFVTAPHSVVDIFGSTLLNIVTLNGCCCKILHNNSEFPTWMAESISRFLHTLCFHQDV